jgi:hypothetical protein
VVNIRDVGFGCRVLCLGADICAGVKNIRNVGFSRLNASRRELLSTSQSQFDHEKASQDTLLGVVVERAIASAARANFGPLICMLCQIITGCYFEL